MKVQKIFNLLGKNQDTEPISPTESLSLSPRTHISNSTQSLPDDGDVINAIRQDRMASLFSSTGPFGSTFGNTMSSASDIPITAHMSSMNDMATMYSINPSSGKQSPPTWPDSHSSSINVSTIDGQMHSTSIFSKLTSGSASTFDAIRNSMRSPTRQSVEALIHDRKEEGVDGSDHEEKSNQDSFSRRRSRSKGSPGGLLLPSSISSPTNRFLTSAMLYEDAESGHDNNDVTGRLSALQVGKTQSRTLLLNDDDDDDVNVIQRGNNSRDNGNINVSWKMTSSSSSSSIGFARPCPQRPLFQSPSSTAPLNTGFGPPFNHGSSSSRDQSEGIHGNPATTNRTTAGDNSFMGNYPSPHLGSHLGSPLPGGEGSPADMDMSDQYVAEAAVDGGFKYVVRDNGQASSSSSSRFQRGAGLGTTGVGTDRTQREYLSTRYDRFDQSTGRNITYPSAGDNPLFF